MEGYILMLKFLTENPSVSPVVERSVIASGAVFGADLVEIIDLTINPLLQSISLLVTIFLSSYILYKKLTNKE